MSDGETDLVEQGGGTMVLPGPLALDSGKKLSARLGYGVGLGA